MILVGFVVARRENVVKNSGARDVTDDVAESDRALGRLRETTIGAAHWNVAIPVPVVLDGELGAVGETESDEIDGEPVAVLTTLAPAGQPRPRTIEVIHAHDDDAARREHARKLVERERQTAIELSVNALFPRRDELNAVHLARDAHRNGDAFGGTPIALDGE